MHKVILINSVGNRTEHEFASIAEANGHVGSKYPIIFDGKAGHFEGVRDTDEVRFVETDSIFRHFRFAHLPEHLQAVSKSFYALAEWVVLTLPRNPERTVALRKLLEGKDAAVRARIE
jgi:hypothetical protein